MKRGIAFIFCLVISLALFAQEEMYVHKSDHVSMGVPISLVDSVSFSSSGAVTYFSVNGSVTSLLSTEIDSISFGETTTDISVIFEGSSVYVINPLAFEGVSITVSGSDVTVNSSIDTKDINYKISGTTSDGMLKIYSEKRFNLLLDGVNITNTNGPALNIQSKNKATIHLEEGTSNYLTDGATYEAAPVVNDTTTEDQKATLFSEGKLVFEGTGSLTVIGNCSEKHAVCSDDQIIVNEGTITVSLAARDAIHASDGMEISGGTVSVSATGDGIDAGDGYILISGGNITTNISSANSKGIVCDSTLDITGGELYLTVSGDQSKGLQSKMGMTLVGGTIQINTSGNVALEALNSGYNPSYCTAIKCDTLITIDGAQVTIKSTGTGGKGISSDNNVVIKSGSVNITTTGNGATYKNSTGTTDSYNATCLTADGVINILGGTVILSSSGSAGKGISSTGGLTFGDATNTPIVNVTTTGAKITVSGSTGGGGGGFGGNQGGGSTSSTSYSSAKAVKSDGTITINSGTITISSADDGMKSEKSITVNNGTVSITKSTEAMECISITINNGHVSLVASDDGFNATAGLTAGGTENNDGSMLTINGGTIEVSTTTGDGIDSNGSFTMTGGTVIAQGPNSSPELGMDVNGSSNVSGGILIVSGPNSGSNMIEGPSTTSSQYSVMVTSSSIGTNLFHVQDASGNEIITFKPLRSAYYITFSSAALKSGSSYSIYLGGSTTGTNINGYYSGGTYTAGTLKKSFTESSKLTNVSF